eukprot:gnl/MRDRNA2_/MRDRNA2_26315_c0_seq1.p1 gnl/MRDRNA2_/MRDRNA2_26315_c0~~gnl/MRDRNA2_/MRDRNA2_26315_c0_seq1.p1  ORF type:complete len:222 (-),score=31.50 gnl/MRDRNA2_/MRDRNA2_26315_c0_seq1:6-638(-)
MAATTAPAQNAHFRRKPHEFVDTGSGCHEFEDEENAHENPYSRVPQWPPPENSGWRVCSVALSTQDCVDGPEVVECSVYKAAHERLCKGTWGPVIMQGLVGVIQGNHTPEKLCYSLALHQSGILALYFESELIKDEARPRKQWHIWDIQAKSADMGRTLQIWEQTGKHFNEFRICSGPSGRTWQDVISKHSKFCKVGSSPFDSDSAVFQD